MGFGPLIVMLLLVTAPVGSAGGAPDAPAPVVAYYFHGSLRCQTCLAIESLARYGITTDLAADIDSGQLAWLAVNVDVPANEHFSSEFALEGPALVIARYAQGEVQEWTRLEQVWDLHGDVPAFGAYVLGAVEKYLEAASVGGTEAR